MRSLAVLTALFLAMLVAGCGLFPEQQDETAGWSANKLYTEAKEAMNDGAYEKSIKYFEKLESRYPYGRYAQQAQIDIAYAYWKDNEPALAVAACDRFIKLHPNHPNVDYVYYLRGLVNFNEDLGILGQISQQDMTERDPKVHASPSIPSLEVHVARYYMKRGAYIAAANRAQYALKHYPEAAATEEALFIMVKAYDLMGMNDLRDDAERVMRKNYPNSVYYTRGLERKEPWWKLW